MVLVSVTTTTISRRSIWKISWKKLMYSKFPPSILHDFTCENAITFGQFVLSYNSKFHFVKFPPADLILKTSLYLLTLISSLQRCLLRIPDWQLETYSLIFFCKIFESWSLGPMNLFNYICSGDSSYFSLWWQFWLRWVCLKHFCLYTSHFKKLSNLPRNCWWR